MKPEETMFNLYHAARHMHILLLRRENFEHSRHRTRVKRGGSSVLTINATLNPRTSLSRGDPKHEATPIPGFPARATAVSATKSPTEFPMASTVSPSMAGDRSGKQYILQSTYQFVNVVETQLYISTLYTKPVSSSSSMLDHSQPTRRCTLDEQIHKYSTDQGNPDLRS